MNSINAIASTSSVMSSRALSTQMQVAALKKQQNTMRELGDMAVQLIKQAGIADPAVGKKLDISG